MSRVLIICHDAVGQRMAGPAIRAWELARVLSRSLQVTLAANADSMLEPDGFSLLPFTPGSAEEWRELERVAHTWADVVVFAADLLLKLPFLRELQIPLVADAHVPLPIESLAWHARSGEPSQLAAYRYSWEAALLIARHADFLMVANERQRDFWLGILAASGRLHPQTYSSDSSLRNLVDVVPAGCPAAPPKPGRAMKGVWPGIGARDRVIVWSGGVWNWLDPITLLQAMPFVAAQHPDARLVFLGASHPDPQLVPEMATACQARALSMELELDGRTVFWGDWIRYSERGAYLLDADASVSLHRTGLEPHFASRTRLLDSVWAGLPTVLTEGDVLGEELERLGLGVVVPPYDVAAVTRALVALLGEPGLRERQKPRFDALRAKYAWERAAEPLIRFCSSARPDTAKTEAMARTETSESLPSAHAQQSQTASLQAEIARLHSLVQGYESGRVMRILTALQRWRRGGRR